MGLSMRGELTAADFNQAMKKASLEIAAGINNSGGPRNRWERAFVDLAEVAGNTLQDIEAAADSIPKLVKPLP